MKKCSMLNKFINAKPIYPEKYLLEKNISLFFIEEIDLKRNGNLKITSNNIYRLFDNGKLIGYGPSRASHNYFRLDEYHLSKGHHYLVIELLSSHCNSYYTLNTNPFLVCEIYDNNIYSYTGLDNHFKCYLNSSRYQKVSRFSYQRTFSESYHFSFNFHDFIEGKINPFSLIECQCFEHENYLNKNVEYVNFPRVGFKQIEEGKFLYNEQIKPYEDRYMYLNELKIFPKNEWEVNPNDYISRLEYSLEKIDCLKQNTFVTYKLDHSYTGFIEFEIECLSDCEIYFIFDEIDASLGSKEPVKINFFRNTTQNIVSYEIKKGLFKHICFEPYTIQYLRLVIKKGEIKIKKIDFIKYESSEINKFKFEIENKKIKKIFSAAINTYAQNSVDILTDCPSRERAGWLFDSYFTSMSEFLITGQNKVEHNFLENYAYLKQYQTLPKGMIPMCYPGEFPDGNFIPNWSMWYILELNEYLKRSNDQNLIDLSKEKIVGLLNYFVNFENELGLLEDLKGWIFVEWSKANDEEFIKGVNFPSNMLYSACLKAAGELLNDYKLIEKSNNVINKIKEYSFNGEFFIDNMIRVNNEFVLTNNITETCQYYAFYFNVATKEEYPNLFETLLKKFGPSRDYEKVYPHVYKSNVLIGDYLRLFILLRYGYLNEVKEETISYFYKMATLTGTIWEHDSVFASLNHGLTSCVLVILVNAIFSFSSFDEKNKIIYLNKHFINEKGKIEINLKGGKLILINDGKKIDIIKPDNYQIEYLK